MAIPKPIMQVRKPPELQPVEPPPAAVAAFIRGDKSEPAGARGDAGATKPKGAVKRADGTEARRLVVYLPPELMQRLRVHCAETEVSLSAVVVEAVDRHLASRDLDGGPVTSSSGPSSAR